jgi:hypothetical protein
MQDARILTGDDLLDGADVLPGFSVPVNEFFATDWESSD